MNTTPKIVVNGSDYAVSDLTVYGFVTKPQIKTDSRDMNGVLCLNDQRLEIEFKIRTQNQERSTCTFSNLSIAIRDSIQKYVDNALRVDGQELETRSYDELARGLTSNESSAELRSNRVPQRSAQFKSVALLVLLLMMLGLAVLAMVFLRSRSSLSVDNAALVGNYLPVNAKIEGEIANLHVAEGQQVRRGDLLLQLKNPEIESTCIQAEAARDAAIAKVVALQKQQDNYHKKLQVASRKLVLDLEVAKSELGWAKKIRNAAEARVKRLVRYVESGSITKLEFEEAEEESLAAEAQVLAARNLVKQIEFSQLHIKDGILILGDRLDDEIGRITAELEIAQSELKELEIVCNEAANQVDQLEIKAPRDGQIYSTYRQQGEYLKIAEEAIAISYPGKTWAAGHVTLYQASRIRPGQPVTVGFPSLDLKLDGVVLGVGHRAMYSKGGYNADFRGTTATDVPVKVRINDLPREIPSGIRIEMAINTGYGLKWLDDVLGYELKPINESPAMQDTDTETVINGNLNIGPIAVTRTDVR